MGHQPGCGLHPKRAAVVAAYTECPVNATTVCVDELGPVSPRTFPPAGGWTKDGHRVKAPLEYSRGLDRTWVYGALRVRDGQVLTQCGPSRNTVGYVKLLEAVERDNPEGDILVVSDNLASHKSAPVQAWLETHPRVRHVFIPKGACWLNLIEPWWRLLRREAFAGMTFVDAAEVEQAVQDGTRRLNARACPWVWGRPARTPRFRRHAVLYRY
ncbi:IS630 family transposase [Deinococcus peraridilitoris]|uniref:IS630 family transposase n=1 Tax=Deinococcus peraridilitoris TaxID=432329 RepID=UPI001C27EFAA|nr:IS630 family transposase [Deinococcus peraridilitoris]